MGPNDFTTEVRNNDEDGRLFNMNNMQLSFLSGRDGMDYYKPGEDFGDTGNGLVNAYNKGKEFEGLGPAMGGSSRAIGSYNDADLPSAALAQIKMCIRDRAIEANTTEISNVSKKVTENATAIQNVAKSVPTAQKQARCV